MIICIYPKYLSPDLQASILLGLRFHSAVSSGQPIFIILLPDCRSSPIRRLLVLKQNKTQLHNFVLFVLEFNGPVNNEVMSSRSVNSGTVPGQA